MMMTTTLTYESKVGVEKVWRNLRSCSKM